MGALLCNTAATSLTTKCGTCVASSRWPACLHLCPELSASIPDANSKQAICSRWLLNKLLAPLQSHAQLCWLFWPSSLCGPARAGCAGRRHPPVRQTCIPRRATSRLLKRPMPWTWSLPPAPRPAVQLRWKHSRAMALLLAAPPVLLLPLLRSGRCRRLGRAARCLAQLAGPSEHRRGGAAAAMQT